ncbi:lytic transglycosylase domain-containing protein [Paenibacillus sp. GCM10012307]|uniref:Lytic transglycosylase domain-containing protein n=1 Tax=Paenibacillus roseus TaxID=2798579 RepID=A0A934MSC5_9BACL|nr:lytic transglycosylase domain-containing protein [Paenibacillus roseus]MBJ6363129.1 lytic transglycosylase domain-containing protein [Paenibacillus roseus]
MSIDPRIMRTWLQMQWMPSADLDKTASDNIFSAEDGSPTALFQTLLNQLIQSQPSAAGAEATGAASIQDQLAALSAANWAPIAAQSTTLRQDSTNYDALIDEASYKYGVDRSLIASVIHNESSFNSNAVSSSGAKGLMQLMDGTARGLGVTDSFDPVQNIDGGTRYLSYLLRKYEGNEAAALAAYNAGPGRIDRLGIRNDEDVVERLQELPSETRNYIQKVLTTRGLYSL